MFPKLMVMPGTRGRWKDGRDGMAHRLCSQFESYFYTKAGTLQYYIQPEIQKGELLQATTKASPFVFYLWLLPENLRSALCREGYHSENRETLTDCGLVVHGLPLRAALETEF